MANKEAQEEEREVLLSIYEGDSCFKPLTDTSYQYRVGESSSLKSFLLEISWSEKYPQEKPNISLGAFYNNHISPSLKKSIITKGKGEAEQWIGCAMTYTLFEWAKENAVSLMEEQAQQTMEQRNDVIATKKQQPTGRPKQKKEQLTKSQKRKITNRTDYKGECQRGWDWVDVIKLSRTGNNN